MPEQFALFFTQMEKPAKEEPHSAEDETVQTEPGKRIRHERSDVYQILKRVFT